MCRISYKNHNGERSCAWRLDLPQFPFEIFNVEAGEVGGSYADRRPCRLFYCVLRISYWKEGLNRQRCARCRIL